MTTELSPFVSEGYRATTEKPAIGFEIFVPAPAGGISSTAGDMGRFATALLNGGELEGQRILKTETRDLMWTRQFGVSDSLPPMCMGFYQTWRNNLHFIGHDGDLVAFHSMFLIEPAQKLALFVSYNSAGSAGRNRTEILEGFADRYFPAYNPPAFQKFSIAELKAISGTYQSTRRADSTKLAIGNIGGQSVAKVDKDGVLTIDTSKDLRGHTRKWKPLGKDLWQVDDDQARLFAIRDSSGKIVRLAVNFPGVQLQRIPFYENKSVIVSALSASVVIFLFVVVARLSRIGRRLLFRNRPGFQPQPGTIRLGFAPTLAAFLWTAAGIYIALLARHLQNDALPSFPVIQRYFWYINMSSILAALLSVFALISGIRIWNRTDLRGITKVKFSLVAAACVFVTWYAIHWNLIGPIYRF